MSAGVNSTWTVRRLRGLRGCENVGRGKGGGGREQKRGMGREGRGRRGGRKRKQGQAAAGAMLIRSAAAQKEPPGRAAMRPASAARGDEHHHVPGSQAEKGGGMNLEGRKHRSSLVHPWHPDRCSASGSQDGPRNGAVGNSPPGSLRSNTHKTRHDSSRREELRA